MHIVVLSQTINQPPANLHGKVEMFSGDVPQLITQLEQQGYQHAYVDGGQTITRFLELQLINSLTLTIAPVILGRGIRLFGKVNTPIDLKKTKAKAFANHFVQIKYELND